MAKNGKYICTYYTKYIKYMILENSENTDLLNQHKAEN